MAGAFVGVRARRDALPSKEEYPAGPGHPTIKPRSRVVFFERGGDDILFTATTSVLASRRIQSTPINVGGQAWQVVEFEPPTFFDKARHLSILAGSLAKVRRFDDPARHFRRGVVAFQDEDDFAVIQKDLVDPSRTAFRVLFHSLSLRLQAQFIAEHRTRLRLDNEGRFQDYEEPARLLLEFIQDAVAEPLQLLGRIANAQEGLYEELRDPRLELSRLELAGHAQTATGQADDLVVPVGQLAREARSVIPSLDDLHALTQDRLRAESMVEWMENDPRVWGRGQWNETIW